MRSVKSHVKSQTWNQVRVRVYERVDVQVRALVWNYLEREVHTWSEGVRFPMLDQLK